MTEVKNRLKTYASKTHEDVLKAKNDPLLPTEKLIELCKELIEAEKNEEEYDNFPLLILHQRANEYTLKKSIQLVQSSNSIDRELGCRILQEFPRLDDAPTQFSVEIIENLKALLLNEKDEDILLWALSAIAWQCHPKGVEILLKMQSDPGEQVRYIVANNLLISNQVVSDEIANAFIKFTKDPSEEVSSSVFYDIAEYPKLFTNQRKLFLKAARFAFDDSSQEVKKEALRAYNSLLENSNT
jgi:hypothetical protein